MKRYLYAVLFLFLFSISSPVKVSAQNTPSGQTNSNNDYPDNRPNYNYLGLLGLLGLYGLHKNRTNARGVIDQKAM